MTIALLLNRSLRTMQPLVIAVPPRKESVQVVVRDDPLVKTIAPTSKPFFR